MLGPRLHLHNQLGLAVLAFSVAHAEADDLCLANQYASEGECAWCPAGKTSVGGVNPVDGDTLCNETICAADEYVLANTCVACAEGTENPLSGDPGVGDAASGANTVCTPVRVTGMCAGNTNDTADVTCPDGSLLRPDPETIYGSSAGECCDDVSTSRWSEVEYRWEATAWGVCAFQCGATSTVVRTVQCIAVMTYSNGAVTRAEADDAMSCEGEEPADTMSCPALAEGTACDDDDDTTTGDACTAAGGCEGKRVMKSSLTFPVAATDFALPMPTATPEAITESPIGVALSASIKSSLVATLGSNITVAILSMQADTLVVVYSVVLPPNTNTTTVDGASAALEAELTSAPPTLPATDGGADISAGIPYVEPFKTYAYTRTTGCTQASDCSNACGFEGQTAADVYQCLEDGAPVVVEACEDAGIGPVPTSESTCCLVADEDTCVGSRDWDDWDDWDDWGCGRLRRLETTRFRRRLCDRVVPVIPSSAPILDIILGTIVLVLCLLCVKCCAKCGSHHNRSDREHPDVVVAAPVDPVGDINHAVVEAQIVEEGDTRRTPPPRRPDHLGGRGPVSMCC